LAQLPFFHVAERACVARAEGVEPVCVHLRHVLRRMHGAGECHDNPAGARRRRHCQRISDVLRPVGCVGAGRSHRTGQHHRFARRQNRLQEIGGFLHRVSAVGDHHALHIGLRQPVRAAFGELPPDLEVHVLAVDLRDLLAFHHHARRKRDALQQLAHAHLAGRVADVVLAAARTP
jgi:hypothetical protein